MPPKPTYSEEQIIAMGKAMEAARGPGATVEASDIHRALGGQGRPAIVARVWQEHCATRATGPAASRVDPSEGRIEAECRRVLEAALAEIAALHADEVARRDDAHRVQIEVLLRQGAERDRRWEEAAATERDEAARLRDEIADLREAPGRPGAEEARGPGSADPADVSDDAPDSERPAGAADRSEPPREVGAVPPTQATPPPAVPRAPGRPAPSVSSRGPRRAPARPVHRDVVKRGGGGPRPRALRILDRPDAAQAQTPASISRSEGGGRTADRPAPRADPDADAQRDLPFGG